MMLGKDFLVELVETRNPIEVIWNKLNEIWKFGRVKKLNNIEQLYLEKEKKSCKFEEMLSRIFFEIYDELIENSTRNTFLKEISRKNDEAIIIMDGFSIREANLLFTQLKSKKYAIDDYFYSFSALPSTTEIARKVFYQDFFSVTRKEDVERLPSLPEKIIWCAMPDILLHSKQKGRIEVLSLDDCLKKTFDTLFSIIDKIEVEEILITSDHGYLYFPEYGTWWDTTSGIEKVLRRIFGSERFREVSKLDEKMLKILEKLSKDGYVTEIKDYVLVKGRWFWSAKGRFSPIFHGGLSFMECLIPVIKLRRV